MKRALITLAILLCLAASADAQSGAPRAWQQRIEVAIDLPVPIVTLESVNPFAITVDEPPRLVESTPPKKFDVAGDARIAVYVTAKGECPGAVPLELPFPGLTGSILEEIKGVRFDPATTVKGPVPSWVVLDLHVGGRIKEASVGAPTFELPDPSAPPEPAAPLRVAPSGSLLNAPYEDPATLATFASPRRLKVKAPAQNAEVPVRALVHITESGRCDRFVPLDIEAGLHPWLSAYLATWRLEPARLDGSPHEAWVVYSARAKLELTSLDSTGVTVVRSERFAPPGSAP